MRSADRYAIVACLLALGLWQIGERARAPAEAWLAQELMARAWQRAGEEETEPVPWPWTDTWPVARLIAQGGRIDQVVLAGGSGRTLAFGPGHLGASALPGEPGNSVIAGHRDTHFAFLKNLALGEVVVVESGDGARHAYTVVGLDVMDARRASIVLDSDRALLTLVTGYPFDAPGPGGSLRYVVTAELQGEAPPGVAAAISSGISPGS
jgi:sortase A